MICTKLENARIWAEDMVGFHSKTGEWKSTDVGLFFQ